MGNLVFSSSLSIIWSTSSMFSYNSRYSELYFLITHKNSSSSNQLNGNTDWWQNWHIQVEILSSIERCSSGTNVKHFMWYFPLQKLQHICLEWLKNLEWHMLQHIMLTTYGVIYKTLGECAFITASVGGSGCEYSLDTGICNVCTKNLSSSQEITVSKLNDHPGYFVMSK